MTRLVVIGLTVAAFAAVCPLAAQKPDDAVRKVVMNRPGARPGPFSSAVRVGDLLFLSGGMGTKPEGGSSCHSTEKSATSTLIRQPRRQVQR